MAENAVAPTRKLVRTQEAVVAAALDPRNKTVTAVARVAGVARQTASRSLCQNETVLKELEVRRGRQADKARGFADKAKRLLHDGLDESHDLDPATKVQVAGSTLKLAHELGAEEVKVDSSAQAQWLRKYGRRCYRAGFRAALAGRDPLDIVVSPHGESEVIEKA